MSSDNTGYHDDGSPEPSRALVPPFSPIQSEQSMGSNASSLNAASEATSSGDSERGQAPFTHQPGFVSSRADHIAMQERENQQLDTSTHIPSLASTTRNDPSIEDVTSVQDFPPERPNPEELPSTEMLSQRQLLSETPPTKEITIKEVSIPTPIVEALSVPPPAVARHFAPTLPQAWRKWRSKKKEKTQPAVRMATRSERRGVLTGRLAVGKRNAVTAAPFVLQLDPCNLRPRSCFPKAVPLAKTVVRYGDTLAGISERFR